GRAHAAHEELGHTGAGPRGDGVGPNAEALELTGEDDRHRRDARFGRAVVQLAGVAEQARLRRRVDDRGVDGLARLLGLGPPVGTCETGRHEVALEVDVDDGVPVGLLHVEAHAVAEDAGVVDQDVESPELVDGLLDELLAAFPRGDVIEVGSGVAARPLDLVDDLLGGPLLAGLTGHRTPHVVDDDLRPFGRQQEGLGAPDSPPRTSDDRDLAVQQTHAQAPDSLTKPSVYELPGREGQSRAWEDCVPRWLSGRTKGVPRGVPDTAAHGRARFSTGTTRSLRGGGGSGVRAPAKGLAAYVDDRRCRRRGRVGRRRVLRREGP